MSGGLQDPPRFLVIQNGARHNYAVPEAFHRAGALAGVYTDFTATHGLGGLISRVARGRSAQALARRTPPVAIRDCVRSSDVAFLLGAGVTALPGGERHGIWLSKRLNEQRMLRRGAGDATHIYTMLGEGGRFVHQAKAGGLGIVSDVYIALSADRIVAQEAAAFPDWCAGPPPRANTRPGAKRPNDVLLGCSDLFVCPSDFVRDDLVEHHGVDRDKTCVIPYAVSPVWLSLDTRPEPGRVLFAGTAGLRKGVHYLARAARLLKGTCDVIVAGGASAKVRGHPEARDLTFLGHLSKSEMAREFARADVFVLPSLAEGAAGVTAEALGAGVPVVTTKAAGSIVRHGIDGLIVPERDPEAIAQAVAAIAGDRPRRAAMGYAARERAQQVTWDGLAVEVIAEVRRQSF